MAKLIVVGLQATDSKLFVIDAATAGAARTRIGNVIEQVPALILGVAEQCQREDAGHQVEVFEHQSSESSLATGAWSLSDQRRVSKAARRSQLKMGNRSRKMITSTKLDQPVPPFDTSTVL